MASMRQGCLDIAELSSRLQTRRVGRRIEHLDSTSSTNEEACRRCLEPDSDGMVIFAEHQKAGRGRLGRTWLAPRGSSILVSVIVIDGDGEFSPGEMALIPPVAVVDAIRATTGLLPAIKWPNDVLLSGQKVGGVLVESRESRDAARAYVVGIGINCLQQPGHFPPELAGRATSLEIESTHAIDRTALATELLQQLDRWIGFRADWTEADLRRDWRQRAAGFGERVRIRHEQREYTGTIVDIDPAAALVLRLDDGVMRAFPAIGTSLLDTAAGLGTIER